jgi:preprotein translocase subunit YajC
MTQLVLVADDPPPPQGPSPYFLPMMLGMLLLFWVIVILPMSRRQKREQEAMLAGLKRGARVLTSGGIVATIVSARDGEDEIVIRSEDTRLRIRRNVVVQVLGTDEAEAAKS